MKELLANGSYVSDEGDVLPPDGSDELDKSFTLPGLPIDDRPLDGSDIEVDDLPDEIDALEQLLRTKIMELLLLAHDAAEAAKQSRIHESTRKRHLAPVAEYRTQADNLIKKLPSFEHASDEDEDVVLSSVRWRLREEALAERAAAQKAEVLGRAAQKWTGLDVKSLAAGEDVKRRYDED